MTFTYTFANRQYLVKEIKGGGVAALDGEDEGEGNDCLLAAGQAAKLLGGISVVERNLTFRY